MQTKVPGRTGQVPQSPGSPTTSSFPQAFRSGRSPTAGSPNPGGSALRTSAIKTGGALQRFGGLHDKPLDYVPGRQDLSDQAGRLSRERYVLVYVNLIRDHIGQRVR